VPPCVILDQRTMSKVQLPMGKITVCLSDRWQEQEHKRKHGMLVLNAFKGHLSIYAMTVSLAHNTDCVDLPV
jgi:hypothetical protein